MSCSFVRVPNAVFVPAVNWGDTKARKAKSRLLYMLVLRDQGRTWPASHADLAKRLGWQDREAPSVPLRGMVESGLLTVQKSPNRCIRYAPSATLPAKGYFCVPVALLDACCRVGWAALLTYLCLLCHADAQGHCFSRKPETIAAETDLDPRKVKTALVHLQQLGMMECDENGQFLLKVTRQTPELPACLPAKNPQMKADGQSKKPADDLQISRSKPDEIPADDLQKPRTVYTQSIDPMDKPICTDPSLSLSNGANPAHMREDAARADHAPGEALPSVETTAAAPPQAEGGRERVDLSFQKPPSIDGTRYDPAYCNVLTGRYGAAYHDTRARLQQEYGASWKRLPFHERYALIERTLEAQAQLYAA